MGYDVASEIYAARMTCGDWAVRWEGVCGGYDGGNGNICMFRGAKVTRNNFYKAAHDVQRVATSVASMLMCRDKVGERCVRSCERRRKVAWLQMRLAAL